MDKERYLRHIMLENVGIAGQERLLSSSALVIGAGGLGSPVLLYLAAAGLGRIGIVDFDLLDVSNLQRQIIHTTASLGMPKVISAATAMQGLNPDVKVEYYQERFEASNALSLIAGYEMIIDATDNFEGKFLINDAAVLSKTPLIHAGILKFRGQALTCLPYETACFACAFDAPPPKELNPIFKAGLFGALPGLLGSVQASEAIKLALGIGELLTNRLLMVDTLSMDFRTIKISKNPRCRVCGEDGIRELKDY